MILNVNFFKNYWLQYLLTRLTSRDVEDELFEVVESQTNIIYRLHQTSDTKDQSPFTAQEHKQTS